MSWVVGNWEFEGPHEKAEELHSCAGLYVVFCGTDETFDVYEIGFANDVRTHLEGHVLHDQWIYMCSGRLCVIVLYSEGRSEKEMNVIKDAVERELLSLEGA